MISFEKTVCVPFSLCCGLSLVPILNLNSISISVKQAHKFLGIIFDRKLNLVPHIKELKQKCLRSSNILKVLSHMSGHPTDVVSCSFTPPYLQSRLDYGA